MAKYFVEYGALQSNAQRLIETETSANPAVKISDNFAKRIAYALNRCEPDGDGRFIPSKKNLDELEVHARRMIDQDVYGGGILLKMIDDYRRLRQAAEDYESIERDCNGNPL